MSVENCALVASSASGLELLERGLIDQLRR
jgi:hypothetical protein